MAKDTYLFAKKDHSSHWESIMGNVDAPADWCPLERALDLIGGKWKGLILWYLGSEGSLGHAELKRRLERVSQKVMTAQLRQLENDGLVARRVHPTVPPRVEYSLTELGAAVRPAIEALRVWASDRHADLCPFVVPTRLLP